MVFITLVYPYEKNHQSASNKLYYGLIFELEKLWIHNLNSITTRHRVRFSPNSLGGQNTKNAGGRTLYQSEKESWIRRTLTEQPALLVSLMYLLASVIGLFYSWAFLRPFGINMLQYAEISDFLLASIKEPLTWVLTLFAVAVIQLDNAMSRRVQSRKPGRYSRWFNSWYGSDRYRQFNYSMFVILAAAFLFGYADLKERDVRDGGTEVYEVQLADGSPPEQRVLLGTTVNFIFLYDPPSERVSIHPNESVLSLSKKVPEKPVEKPSVPDDSEADTPKPKPESSESTN